MEDLSDDVVERAQALAELAACLTAAAVVACHETGGLGDAEAG